MNQRDEQVITHIYFHCKDIQEFIERFGDSFEAFCEDRAYFNSVSMAIMQISELSRELSDEFTKSTNEKMPWSKVKGIRNLIASALLFILIECRITTQRKDGYDQVQDNIS